MGTIGLIERALNIRAFYHKVLAGNIANAETPGYKERDVDFRAELDKRAGGLAGVDVKEKTESEEIQRIDGNTVNMENQTMRLTENSLMFGALAQIVSKKFSMMRYLINEGRR